MRPYETMIIFDPELEEPALNAAIERALQVVRSHGGATGQVDRWGRRAFAYELKKKREGVYIVADFSAEPEAAAELDRSLFLADEVLRHKIMRIPDHVVGRPRLKPSGGAAGAPAVSSAAPSRRRRRPPPATWPWRRRPRPRSRPGRSRARTRRATWRAATPSRWWATSRATRAPVHRQRAGDRQLRPGREPPVAEPPDPGVGGGDVVHRHRVLARDGRERGREPGAAGRASSSPGGWTSGPGRRPTATSARRSRSWRTRSARACGGRRRR